MIKWQGNHGNHNNCHFRCLFTLCDFVFPCGCRCLDAKLNPKIVMRHYTVQCVAHTPFSAPAPNTPPSFLGIWHSPMVEVGKWRYLISSNWGSQKVPDGHCGLILKLRKSNRGRTRKGCNHHWWTDREAALTGGNPALAWMIKCATGAIYGQLKRPIICPNPLPYNDLTHANKTLSRKTFLRASNEPHSEGCPQFWGSAKSMTSMPPTW